MAVRKRPSGTPSTPGPEEGVAGIESRPFADPLNRASVEIPNRPAGGISEFDQSQADFVQINQLVGIAEQVEKSFFSPTFAASVNFNGRDWDKQEFDKELARLRKLQTKATKRYEASSKVVFDLEDKVAKAKDDLEQSQYRPGNRSKDAALQNKVDAAEKQLSAAKSVPAGTKITAGTVKKGAEKPAAKPAAKEVTSASDVRRFEETGTTAPTPATTTQPTPTSTGAVTGGTGGGGTGGTAGTGGRGGKGGPKGAPEKPIVGQRYTGPKGATFEWDGKKWNRITGTEWAGIVQQEFGSLWDVYNGNADVKAVLDQSVKEGWFNDETKLSAQLQNTGWYRTTERSARQFAIRNSTDPASVEDEIVAGMEGFRQQALANGFTFDDMTLRRLSTDKIKYGWSEQQTTNAVGSEAVAQAQGRGAQGLSDLRSGFVGQNLRKIAKSYAQKPSETQLDSFINDIMTGKKTQQQFIDLMRNGAKTQFRSLASAIDQGQDVETAMYGYQQAAQSTLGNVVDTSTIDWTSDKWNKALNFRDEKTGEYRQMDLWEWNKYLRKLPEWQQTDEAKQTYQNVAYALAQGFGKTA
jgi:hypothetical protein